MSDVAAEVLCVGVDDTAMQTRRLILEKAGHAVSQARDLREVTAACEAKSFSVVILGHSLNAHEKRRITEVILRECTPAKVLELHTAMLPDIADADAHLHVTARGPEALVEAVNLLTTPRKKKSSRSPLTDR